MLNLPLSADTNKGGVILNLFQDLYNIQTDASNNRLMLFYYWHPTKSPLEKGACPELASGVSGIDNENQ